MQKANRHRIYQCEGESTDQDDGSSAWRESQTGATVLVIAGVCTSAVSRGLTRAAALSSANGITLNVFDNLADFPHYSETAENQRLPCPVAALRDAAVEAHAAMVVTHYFGRIPATVHNAIDWLTRQWNHSALHDKPLAVIGPTGDGYSGVWSRRQAEESRPVLGNRIIEPITVTTLHEAVTKLAEQAKMTRLPSPHSRSNTACARTRLR
jgi:NAD(P)H-dependent FMN reductase